MASDRRIDLDSLTTEARNPRSEGMDRLDTLEVVRLVNAEDATVAEAVAATPIHAFIAESKR